MISLKSLRKTNYVKRQSSVILIFPNQKLNLCKRYQLKLCINILHFSIEIWRELM